LCCYALSCERRLRISRRNALNLNACVSFAAAAVAEEAVAVATIVVVQPLWDLRHPLKFWRPLLHLWHTWLSSRYLHEMHPATATYPKSRSPLQDQAAHSQVQQGAITASPLPRLRRLGHRLGDSARTEHGGIDFEDDDRFDFS